MSDDEPTQEPIEDEPEADPDEMTGEEIQAAEAELEQQSVQQAQEIANAAPTEIEASQLPPALAAAGLVGMRAVTSGVHSTAGGSTFFLTPGVAFAVSPEDAEELAEAGLVVTQQQG